MAIIYSCGFEAGLSTFYTSGGWTFTGSTSILNTTPHRSLAGEGGDWYLHVDDATTTPVFGATARWLHFWLRQNSSSGGFYEHDILFRRSGATNWTVRFDRRVETGGAVSDRTISGLTSHWVAIELLSLNAAGLCNVYVDGELVVSFAGDTQVSGVAGWDQVRFDDYNKDIDIDDIIVTDVVTGRLGERYITVCRPNGDNTIALTPTPGPTSYTGVDEAPTSTTDYNTATILLQEDIYDMSALAYTPASIDFVQVFAYAMADGIFTQGELTVLSGATTSRSAPIALTVTYKGISAIWETDPNTAAAWLTAGVNAMGNGIRFS